MIPKLEFQFDKEKDLHNIWETCNSKSDYGHNFKKDVTQNILDICEDKDYKRCKKDLQKTMSPFYKNHLINRTLEAFEKSWKDIGKEYFVRLEKITKRKISFNEVNVYLTTSGRCPYNPHGKPVHFFINFFSNIPTALTIAGHELMHIHIHNTDYWTKIENAIGYDKTHDLKEALTELLNLEFRDLWLADDFGYPGHTKLRKYISQQWNKNKDFEKLIELSIKWVKRNGIK